MSRISGVFFPLTVSYHHIQSNLSSNQEALQIYCYTQDVFDPISKISRKIEVSKRHVPYCGPVHD